MSHESLNLIEYGKKKIYTHPEKKNRQINEKFYL